MEHLKSMPPGTVIANRYKILTLIGTGGNSHVYLVYDEKVKKNWALKQCHIRMETELAVLRQITHPVFARIVDVVTAKDEQYLVMDYFKGHTLGEVVKSHPMQEAQAYGIAKAIARALHYLHTMTPPVYYLDCKPDNIILTEQGDIHMIDVGSAIIGDNKKQQYRISGTNAYAPQEQKQRRQQQRIDARTDIYSLGKTIYVLLTGSTRECYDKKGKLSVRLANPAISHGMQQFIARCCNRQPEKRFQSMDEVLYFLEHIETLGNKEKCKAALKRLLVHLRQGMIAIASLFGGYCYTCTKEKLWLMVCLLLLVALFLSCKKTTILVCELEKDIYGCMGRRMLLPFLVLCLLWNGSVTHASKATAKEETKEPLDITLYDEKGRKLLIRQGNVLETDGDILLQIPTDELRDGTHQIILSCEDEAGNRKEYQFRYTKK